MPLGRKDFDLRRQPLGMTDRDNCIVRAPDHQAWLVLDLCAQPGSLSCIREQLSHELPQGTINALKALEFEHIFKHLSVDQPRIAEQLHELWPERVAVAGV